MPGPIDTSILKVLGSVATESPIASRAVHNLYRPLPRPPLSKIAARLDRLVKIGYVESRRVPKRISVPNNPQAVVSVREYSLSDKGRAFVEATHAPAVTAEQGIDGMDGQNPGGGA